jgi:RNA polymerase sigma factor (sigma-70 family)
MANAEDVVQEAYTKALTYIDKYNSERGEFDQWFSTILNNVLKDFKKIEHARGVVYLDAEEFNLPSELVTSPKLEGERFRNGLKELIAKQPVRRQTILTLYYIDGWEPHEIASLLGVPFGNIRLIIHYFKSTVIDNPKGLV